MICCANFVPVKVRISYNFDLVLSQGHVCFRFIPLEAWAERGKYLTKLNTAVENLWRTKSYWDFTDIWILIPVRDSIYNAIDSFPCRIELELNKQSPFAVALIAEKRSPLTWLTSAGIRSLAVLISFLNTSSFLVNILFASSKLLLIRTLKADNSWSFAYIVKESNLLLPELEIRNEDFLEISWALHDVVSEKVSPRYVSQQEINNKSHATFNLNFAGFFG